MDSYHKLILISIAVAIVYYFVYYKKSQEGFQSANVCADAYSGLMYSQQVISKRPVFLAYNPQTRKNDIQVFLNPVDFTSENNFKLLISDCFLRNSFAGCDTVRRSVYNANIIRDNKFVYYMTNPYSPSTMINLVVDTSIPVSGNKKNLELYYKYYGSCAESIARSQALTQSQM